MGHRAQRVDIAGQGRSDRVHEVHRYGGRTGADQRTAQLVSDVLRSATACMANDLDAAPPRSVGQWGRGR